MNTPLQITASMPVSSILRSGITKAALNEIVIHDLSQKIGYEIAPHLDVYIEQNTFTREVFHSTSVYVVTSETLNTLVKERASELIRQKLVDIL